MNKRIVSAGLLSVMAITSLTGCGVAGENIESYPLVPALSQQEVIDYYKESLNYDTIASRTTKVNRVTYELTDVSDEVKNKLKNMALEIQKLLGKDSVQITEGLDPNIHQYIKYVIDDKVLSGAKLAQVKEALGYYFVDVEYDVKPGTTGMFNSNIKWLGIHGAFVEDSKGNITIDGSYTAKADQAMAEYKQENPLYKKATSPVAGARQSPNDVSTYNKVAGMSLNQTAIMPPLSNVYKTPAASENISGYCIFPQGAFTLKDFGYSRSKMEGTATLRYVFKKDVMDPDKIEFTNVYVTNYSINTDSIEIDEQTVAPEFVMVEAEKIMERADRAICNNDLAALASGNIFDDIGVAALYGNMENYCYLQRHMSKLTNIVGRKDGKYLIGFETTVQESPKGTGTNGTYVWNGYIVVQQEGTEFHITDYIITDMNMVTEPQISADSTIMKRLAALNLTGEVTEEEKEGIKQLMQNLYDASTNRQLDGMYACFNTDTNLLSSTHREYLNSQLRGWLLKHGTNKASNYMGVVSQWIGGADDQVEFFTNELIEYVDAGVGLYMQNYYLVSRFNDTWVIDEMKVVESKDVSGAELQSIKQSLQNNKSVTVENADNNVKDESDSERQQQTEEQQQEAE